ncbi:MAG: hypothetical protein LUD69_00275, partial [Oscillospiraceae bacterium]|nr:hypothetical protein [Oscillospiraceae bacterium]
NATCCILSDSVAFTLKIDRFFLHPKTGWSGGNLTRNSLLPLFAVQPKKAAGFPFQKPAASASLSALFCAMRRVLPQGFVPGVCKNGRIMV